jgi:hypothetical protein
MPARAARLAPIDQSTSSPFKARATYATTRTGNERVHTSVLAE